MQKYFLPEHMVMRFLSKIFPALQLSLQNDDPDLNRAIFVVSQLYQRLEDFPIIYTVNKAN